MDYIEVFKNLRTNNKYGRKSPHKAILMLTVIELYEQSVLTENEIFYDERLKSMFLKVWNSVLPKEPLFHPDAYLPFWYLQNDSFWHIVPKRGKEDILSLMRDSNIKPSESKLNDSVRYAELDEDLYFLMTIASGRSSLKRALLETYTQLSEDHIARMAESADNVVDQSLSAMEEYEQILSSKNSDEKECDNESSTELEKQFKELSDDLQIALNYEYFAFLKKNRSERDMMRDVCPNVYALYDCIINRPIQRTDISPSFAFIYDNFLSGLKISLMSEEGSMELIDKIDEAIELLRGNNNKEQAEVESKEEEKETKQILPIPRIEKEESNANDTDSSNDEMEIEHVYLDSRGKIIKTGSQKILPQKDNTIESRKGKTWTEEEERILKQYFLEDKDFSTIADLIGRTQIAIKSRLAKLGLIEYTYGQDDDISTKTGNGPIVQTIEGGYSIENTIGSAFILNKYGVCVFSTDGKLKYLHGRLYRLNLKRECFTLKSMQFDGTAWVKGTKKIVAYPQSELYKVIADSSDYCEDVEDIVDRTNFVACRLKIRGVWYSYDGNLITNVPANNIETKKVKPRRAASEIMKSPLYAVRRQAVLRAMDFFRLPASIRDISRTISRTAWRTNIVEEDVEDILSTMSDVVCVEGKYILRKKL